MDFDIEVSDALIEATVEAVTRRFISVELLSSKAEALSRLKKMIPPGASVSTAAGQTLKEIGFEDFLKSGEHPWRNFKAEIASESEFDKQMKIRRQSMLADYYVGSVNAIAATGEIVFGSQSGSQISAYAYASANPIWVVGVQKIRPDLESAVQRVRQLTAFLQEQARKITGGKMELAIGKLMIFEREDPVYVRRRVTLLLVREEVGL
jgi:LUD domain